MLYSNAAQTVEKTFEVTELPGKLLLINIYVYYLLADHVKGFSLAQRPLTDLSA